MPQPITIIITTDEGFLDDLQHPARVFLGHLNRQQIDKLTKTGYEQTAVLEEYNETGELTSLYYTFNNQPGIAPETINTPTLKGQQFTDEQSGIGNLAIHVQYTHADHYTD